MDEQKLDELAEIFKAISHPMRLRIAIGLSKKEDCNVSVMVEKLGISQPNVSQHLNILKNAGVITKVRKGNFICYKLDNDFVKEIIKSIEEQM